jgi:hypothetical protein
MPYRAPSSLPTIEVIGDELQQFRRIHVYEPLEEVKSFEEAIAIERKDLGDARPSKWFGWWYLTQHPVPVEIAINFLKLSASLSENMILYT